MEDNKIKSNKSQSSALILLTIILVSSFVFFNALPISAQEYENQYINKGSEPLPSGVTPDIELKTFAHLSYRPNPVGLGQTFLVNIWITPSTANTKHLTGFQVTITKPSGEEQIVTMDSYAGDATAWFEWIADEVGTWTLQFDFPGGYFPAGNYTRRRAGYADSVNNEPYSVYLLPSSDGPRELEVQEGIVYSWPESSLPTDYWTRPVHPTNREWWPILGNFPETGVLGKDVISVSNPKWPDNTNIYMSNYNFVPYVQAPDTGHIVWKRQREIGGLVGGTMGIISNYGASNVVRPDIIYAGRAYESITKVIDGKPQDVWQCYDIRTGEIYWEQTGVNQIPTTITYTERSAEAVAGEVARKTGMSIDLLYVDDGYYIKYDPFTGEVNLNRSIAPLSSGFLYADPYLLSVQNLGGGNRRLINWTVARSETTGQTQFQVLSNVTWPWSNLGDSQDFESMIAVDTFTVTMPGQTDDVIEERIEAVNLLTGEVLWSKEAGLGIRIFSSRQTIADQGKVAIRFLDGRVHCWDLRTGTKLWTSEETSWPWSTFGTYSSQSYGGMYISPQYDGVHAIYWETGETAWNTEYAAPYQYETPYTGSEGQTIYSWHASAKIADGKYYIFNAEHSASNPVTRGWKLHCIDVYSGDIIWSVLGGQTGQGSRSREFMGAIADGYLVACDSYTGYQYAFGKGKSETTVSATPPIVGKGSQVLIKGTVMDQSPAQPNTPCVSSDSMSLQMEYLHMQQPREGVTGDGEIIGVPIVLRAIAEDGSTIDIGTTTTEGQYGTFGKAWTPPDEGTYKIVATFEGDDSYGSSGAATWITVGPATSAGGTILPEPQEPSTDGTSPTPEDPTPEQPTPEEPEPEPTAETPLITTEIAIIIAVAAACIIGAVAYIALRRRK